MKAPLASIALLAIGLLHADPPTAPAFHPLTIHTDKCPRWITVADVNHDGHPDILVANAEAGTLTVLLGDGKGSFHPTPQSPLACGHLPNDIAVADMNGDGNPDLVIANHQSPYITILLGDGKGGFHPAPGSPFDVHSRPHPHAVAVADFNSDGKLDVATDDWGNNRIEIMLGDGRGAIAAPGRYFVTGRRPYERLRTADFNHDGIADIVTTNLDDDTVSILLGDGHGGVHNAPCSPFPAGGKPWQLAIDDIDGDGNADLVIIPYQPDLASPSQSAVTILLGDGKGGFHPMPGTPLPLGACRGPNSVAAGDLRGDGHHAIAVSCAESRNLLLFERDATGRFTSSSIATKGGWGSVAIAHLTADRRGQLITADADAGTITIYFQQ